ncbi:unnamed protein product [Rhodiola kirilowii]
MDCTSNNSAQLEQDAVDHNNVQLVNVHVTGDGGVKNDDDVDVERINKATTSGNNSSNNSKTGHKEEEEHVEMSNENNNEVMTAMQPSSPTMMITTMIIKGKRTKRQRLRSPIIHNNTFSQEEAEDEEQLDMANCLILLAQGQSRSPVITRTELSLGIRKRCYSSSVAGVYECKTCNRTFPSFQALGGHRASHKKLNITPIISPLVTVASSSSPLSLQLGNINYARPPPTPTPILVQTNNKSKSRSKSHECAICGSEFSSGQALGGHMRRHRGQVLPPNSSTTATNNIANTTLSLSTAPIAVESSSAAAAAAAKVDRINTGNDGFLSLDLNLPASPENHDQAKFSSFNPKQPQPQQQSAMLFSTPAMVDCFF